jgi:hypothetical protein
MLNNLRGKFFFFNLMFLYYNYIIYDFFSYNPDLVAEFIQKNGTFGINCAFFILFSHYTPTVFLSNVINF